MVIERPSGRVDFPRAEFGSWFATDAGCLDFLEWRRWPDGFVDPHCQCPSGWRVADNSFKCGRCKAQTAVRAGTLFDRRRTQLTDWFAVLAVRGREARRLRAGAAAHAVAPLLPDDVGETPHAFVTDTVAPGTTVVTDGWERLPGTEQGGLHP